MCPQTQHSHKLTTLPFVKKTPKTQQHRRGFTYVHFSLEIEFWLTKSFVLHKFLLTIPFPAHSILLYHLLVPKLHQSLLKWLCGVEVVKDVSIQPPIRWIHVECSDVRHHSYYPQFPMGWSNKCHMKLSHTVATITVTLVKSINMQVCWIWNGF